MAVLTRENLNIPVLPAETVEVAEWGGEVVVRALTLSERDGLGSIEPNTFRRHILARCVTGAEKERLLSEDEWDAEGARNPKLVERLAEKVLRLSGMLADSPNVDGATESADSSAFSPALSDVPSAS